MTSHDLPESHFGLTSLTAQGVAPWPTLERELLGHHKVFSVERIRRSSPRTGLAHDFFVLETGTWVNVIPLTDDGHVLLVKQYRHGTEEMTLEIPGGIVEEGEPPSDAAARELLEETGYLASRVRELGYVHPNPAIQKNRCYTYLATGLRRVADLHTDGTEEIQVYQVPVASLGILVARGIIRHSLVIAAFHFFDLERAGLLPPEGDHL